MSTSDTTTAILEVRVLHKRTYGALFFVDCLITNFAGKPFGMVSVRCTDNTTFSNCNSKDIKVGDVALIKGKRDMSETFKPRPPRLGFFQCEEFTITESWSQMVANPTNSQGKITFTWMHPRASFLGVTVEQLEKESLLQTTRRPIAFIQCTSAQCERVCDYFDGELPANTNKSRVVYIYDSDECPNQRWRDFLISPPEFLHGVIARVMLINKEISPSISLSGAVKTLSDLRRKSSRIPGDIYRDKRLSVFPKEVEVRIKKSNELYMHDHGDEPEDASISTREFLYDVICYSDGLYWIGHNVLRYLVPEDRCPAPSSAYFKLLEIKQRIPFHAEFLNKPWAVDVGASPGGWSYCCIKNFNISSVLAIDPATHMDDMLSDCGFEQHTHTNTEGKLSFKKRIIDSIKSPQIIHAIGKGGDVLDDVLSLSDDTNCPKFSIYVCDVNLEPVHAVDLVEKARPLLASPCLVVLTFKNNFRSKSKYTSHITPLLERLGKFLVDIRQIHLFANTTLETTVVGRVS